MSEQYETIDGKILIRQHNLEGMLLTAFDEGVVFGREQQRVEREMAESRIECTKARQLDVKAMFTNAKPRRGRKPKKD